uniref:Uncharacterized protein n=1 Tax=Timema monikensis TaxID=170555 RepID=A0A7R9EAP2_9NEOP|nr:unnamed protein product [Timema monikensis]
MHIEDAKTHNIPTIPTTKITHIFNNKVRRTVLRPCWDCVVSLPFTLIGLCWNCAVSAVLLTVSRDMDQTEEDAIFIVHSCVNNVGMFRSHCQIVDKNLREGSPLAGRSRRMNQIVEELLYVEEASTLMEVLKVSVNKADQNNNQIEVIHNFPNALSVEFINEEMEREIRIRNEISYAVSLSSSPAKAVEEIDVDLSGSSIEGTLEMETDVDSMLVPNVISNDEYLRIPEELREKIKVFVTSKYEEFVVSKAVLVSTKSPQRAAATRAKDKITCLENELAKIQQEHNNDKNQLTKTGQDLHTVESKLKTLENDLQTQQDLVQRFIELPSFKRISGTQRHST